MANRADKSKAREAGSKDILDYSHSAMNRWVISDRPLRGLLRLQSRRAAVTETQDRPSKANRPAMILIREEESFQRVRRAAWFSRPIHAAVGSVQQRSVQAGNPAFG